MLDRAKFLVVSEIAEVTHEDTAAIEDKVDKALDKCLQTKNTVAREADAEADPGAARAPGGGGQGRGRSVVRRRRTRAPGRNRFDR